MDSDDDNNSRKSRQRPKKKEKNVFSYMESTAETKSPKCLLYNSIAENRKIKVWTRSHTYVRSICMGYLLLFDKYWNLAMVDVDEVYKVPIVKKANDKVDEIHKSNIQSQNERAMMQSNDLSCLTIGDSLCKMNNKGYQILHRHINQLFIRGDNIVMVTYAD